MKLVSTTVDTKNQAEKIAALSVKSGLVACAGFWKVYANYRWKGKFVKDSEYLVEMKCSNLNDAKKTVRLVAANHPYTVPMISINDGGWVNPAYKKWLEGKEK